MKGKGKWRKHDGNGIPDDAHGPVDVEFRDGEVGSYADGESLGGWEHEDTYTDVMVYRTRADRLEVPE